MELIDSMKATNTYEFIIEVLENNFFNSELIKNGWG
jgi:hypothetical protein